MNINCNVIANNIGFSTAEANLRSFFQQVGEVRDISLLRDENGNFKGTAIISFQNPQSAHMAIQKLDGLFFNGKRINISFENQRDFPDTIQDSEDSEIGDCDRYRERHADPANQSEIIGVINDNFKKFFDIFQNKNNSNGINGLKITQNSIALNQKIWKSTSSLLKTGKYKDIQGNFHDIRKMIDESKKGTITVEPNYSFTQAICYAFKNKSKWGENEKRRIYSIIQITEEEALEAAYRIKNEGIREVCVLNSASPTSPGGYAMKGSQNLESTLLRNTSLYSSLIGQPKMYNHHKKINSPFYSDYMIYSPNVVVFRDERNNLIYPYRVSVISAVAINNSEIIQQYPNGENDTNVKIHIKKRIRKILDLCIIQNNKAIVLCAFGCGFYGNKAETISQVFKELLIDEFYGLQFKRIVFAIKGIPLQTNYNFIQFQATFNGP